jgi:hypothetical protein
MMPPQSFKFCWLFPQNESIGAKSSNNKPQTQSLVWILNLVLKWIFGFLPKRIRGNGYEKKKCTWFLECKTSMSWVDGGCRWQGASSQMWGLYQNRRKEKLLASP